MLGSLVSAFLLLAAPVRAEGCLVLPSGQCQVEAPRLLPAGSIEARLDSGARLVVVPAPTTDRVAIELRFRPPQPGPTGTSPGAQAQADAVIAALLGGETAGASGPARRQRRLLLGAQEELLPVEPGAALRVKGPSDHLGELLSLESERLADFSPTAAAVQAGLLASLAARRRSLGDPEHLLLDLALPGPRGGAPPSLLGVQDRYQSGWLGAALTVVVAGDVDLQTGLDLARQAFESLPGGSAGADSATPAPAATRPSGTGLSTQAASSAVGLSRVAVAWSAPPAPAGSRRAAARVLLTELLAGPDAPLQRQLVQEQGLVRRLWVAPRTDAVVVLAEIEPDAHPGAVHAAVEQAAQALVDGSAAELPTRLDAARAHLARQSVLRLEQPGDWASLVAEAVSAGAPAAAVDRHADLVQEIGLDEVQALAAELLRPEFLREVVLTPTEER